MEYFVRKESSAGINVMELLNMGPSFRVVSILGRVASMTFLIDTCPLRLDIKNTRVVMIIKRARNCLSY